MHAHLPVIPALAQALLYGPPAAIRGSQDPITSDICLSVVQGPRVPLPPFPTNTRGLLLMLPTTAAAHLAQAPGQWSHPRPG